ncbi:hypothetical protein RB195_018148 [Necator americanus]|uniref:Uncharacterized protein n=1 Tax=Necator americanus TaxID=51031 RepID=A0ABR1C8E2_NECAM
MQARSSAKSSSTTTTLGRTLQERPSLVNKAGVVKWSNRIDEIRLDHFTTPAVFPRPGSLRLPPFFLSPTSSGWSRLPNPRRHQKGTRAVLQVTVPSVLEQRHLRSV